MPATTVEAVRSMASYLERAPQATRARLAGKVEDETESQRLAASGPSAAVDASEAGVGKVDELERQIASHYSATESGSLIRHFVALSLSGVDTDYRPELSRARAINDLMQNVAAAATELDSAIAALPSKNAMAESERAALMQLVAHVGANESALPTVESILTAEMGRQAVLDSSANENRLVHLVDSYTRLFRDPRKQTEFVRAGIQAQEDPRIKQALESYLESLSNRVDLTQSEADPGPAT